MITKLTKKKLTRMPITTIKKELKKCSADANQEIMFIFI